MRSVLVVTKTSVQEMVRDRTVSLIFFSALALVAISSLLGSLSFDEQRRILIHLGFGAIHWSALGLILFQGAFVIQREVDRQTCLMVLARPISRTEFLLGKFLGIVCVVAAHLLLTGVLLYLLLGFSVPAGRFAWVLVGMLLELVVILAFVSFVCQWVRPVVAVVGGFSLFLVGNWLQEMKFLAERSKDEDFKTITEVFQYAFPNFYRLNFRSESFVDGLSSPDLMGMTMLHFSIWLVLFVFLASVSFSRRDLV